MYFTAAADTHVRPGRTPLFLLSKQDLARPRALKRELVDVIKGSGSTGTVRFSGGGRCTQTDRQAFDRQRALEGALLQHLLYVCK